MKIAEYAEAGQANSVQCRLCPHQCTILPERTGLCRARKNRKGVLYSENYGRITAMALDPVEKKPLYHFFPGSKILSLGSYGCNMRCMYCQNCEISMEKAPWREVSPEQAAGTALDLSARGNIGIAYTYNEPVVWYEYVLECARLVRENGQKNVLITNGMINEQPLHSLMPYIDALNIDLKTIQPTWYRDLGGYLQDVIETIRIAVRYCHVEITMLIVPGKNDSTDEITKASELIAEISPDIPMHISRFFPRHQMADIPATPVKTVMDLVKTAKEHLHYVYPGNC